MQSFEWTFQFPKKTVSIFGWPSQKAKILFLTCQEPIVTSTIAKTLVAVSFGCVCLHGSLLSI